MKANAKKSNYTDHQPPRRSALLDFFESRTWFRVKKSLDAVFWLAFDLSRVWWAGLGVAAAMLAPALVLLLALGLTLGASFSEIPHLSAEPLAAHLLHGASMYAVGVHWTNFKHRNK